MIKRNEEDDVDLGDIQLNVRVHYESCFCRLAKKLGEPRVIQVRDQRVVTYWVTPFENAHFAIWRVSSDPVSHGGSCVKNEPLVWVVAGEGQAYMYSFLQWLSDGDLQLVTPEEEASSATE